MEKQKKMIKEKAKETIGLMKAKTKKMKKYIMIKSNPYPKNRKK